MHLHDAEFEREYAEATRRGEERLRHQPRAIAVRYDRRQRKVVVDLSNGCSLLVPPDVAEGLSTASPHELENVRVLGPGTTVAWPKLDVHFSVEGLLSGSFGTHAWMKSLPRRASRSKTTPAGRRATKAHRSPKKSRSKPARP